MNKPEHIVISDRDKGIVPALQEVFPRAGKKHCMWHVKENIKKKIEGANNWDETINDLVSEAWRAPTEQEFNAAMKDIMNLLRKGKKGKKGKRGMGHKVWEYLCKIPVEEWALWLIADSIKLYGQVASTQIEGLNNTYKDARKNNPTEVFEWINDWCFKELSARQEKAAERKNNGELLTESAAKMLEHEKEESACYRVAGGIINPGYIVHRNGQQDRIDRRRVDWEAGTCTCYRPQQYGIPCRHLLAVAEFRKVHDREYIKFLVRIASPMYLNQNYVEAVNTEIHLPVRNELEPDTEMAPPRLAKRGAGREKGLGRKRSEASRVYTCARCTLVGHN